MHIPDKISGSKTFFLVLYMDDILPTTNDISCCMRWNNLSKGFDIKDTGEASYVIDIKIYKDKFKGILGLSQKTYINKVVKRF